MNQHSYHLSSPDVEQLRSLLGDVAGRFHSAEDPDFLREASLLAHELPRGIRGCVLSVIKPVVFAIGLDGRLASGAKLTNVTCRIPIHE